MSVRVEVKSVADVVADPNNVNKHTVRGHQLVENSLRRRGAFRSIASAGKGVEKPVVMAGNLTLEKAIDAGITEVVNVHVNGNQLVNVVRDDLEPGSAAAIALGIEDNESAKQSYSPDVDILAALAVGDNAILAGLRREDGVLDSMLEVMFDIKGDQEGMEVLLDQAVQLEPSKEYIVVVCENGEEFDRLRQELKLQEVRRGGYRVGSEFDDTGTERVVKAERLFEVLDARRNSE